MSEYTPDRWVVIEFARQGRDPVQKVLGGWYGGYTKGDSWRLNSGIERVVEAEDYYEFYGYSGSVYRCYKHAYGMSGYMRDVYASFSRDFAELAESGDTMSIVSDYEYKE
jgi:hypothetical protein